MMMPEMMRQVMLCKPPPCVPPSSANPSDCDTRIDERKKCEPNGRCDSSSKNSLAFEVNSVFAPPFLNVSWKYVLCA
jgi:hypothetical protein